ncbi:MAG: hypothetical protein LBV43_10275 [Prevotella sp.]|jgi:hypothetical protein|nr:hypothetical protein [Prevotella sp.]
MVALVIIYNHKYDKNIPILENIYKDQFSNIFHLVPFYTGEKENVIAVYENSHYFQGYIVQSYQILKSKGDFDHYFFIGDDLLLNPKINEETYMSYFQIKRNDTFISEIFETSSMSDKWLHSMKVIGYTLSVEGIEITKELPSKEDILPRFHKLGLQTPYYSPQKVYAIPQRKMYAKNLKGLYCYYKDKRRIENLYKIDRIELEYPIACGYSDIVIIPKDEFKTFAHYCGIFAASRLFVEAAIPTSIILSCSNIKTEKDIKLKGKLFWGNDRTEFEDEYKHSLHKLLNEFPNNILYFHPVKLSKWQIDTN